MPEKVRGGATPDRPAEREHMELARKLIAAAEPIDDPTVPVLEGFEVSRVLQLPAPTPEAIEATRQKTAGPTPDRRTGMSTPRSCDTPLNSGGPRTRGWLSDH